MNMRKGSIVRINNNVTGIFANHVGKCFRVENIAKGKKQWYVRIAGIMLPVTVVDYMGPQKKRKIAA